MINSKTKCYFAKIASVTLNLPSPKNANYSLFLKYNLSLRAIKACLNINVSHLAIYKWIIKLSSVISLFEFENVFKVHGSEV
ncbi:hypothetical protein [Fervidobacterium nodosum]|uniref:hypothetical protein n=1 Tax=Fervidobacterium nodosum TaxID=2424 RepID=UPI0000E7B727|nr:hypothetical protein [Fervidobacterium nodosum]